MTSGLAQPRSCLGIPGPFSTRAPPQRVATGRLRAGPRPRPAKDRGSAEAGGGPSAQGQGGPRCPRKALRPWALALASVHGHGLRAPTLHVGPNRLAVHTAPRARALASSAQRESGPQPEPITPGRSLQRGPRPRAGVRPRAGPPGPSRARRSLSPRTAGAPLTGCTSSPSSSGAAPKLPSPGRPALGGPRGARALSRRAPGRTPPAWGASTGVHAGPDTAAPQLDDLLHT